MEEQGSGISCQGSAAPQTLRFPAHKCGLYLTHNEHKDIYQPLAKWLVDREFDDIDLGPEDREECIRTDSLWHLQWFPDTPVGHYSIYGPTLESVLQAAADAEAEILARSAKTEVAYQKMIKTAD